MSRPWIKLWENWVTTPSHSELTGEQLGLGALFLLVAGRDPLWKKTGEGRLLRPNGKPHTVQTLAKALRTNPEWCGSCVDAFIDCKTMVNRDGLLVFPTYRRFQENPAAYRMRQHRARQEEAVTDPEHERNAERNSYAERYADVQNADVTASSIFSPRSSVVNQTPVVNKHSTVHTQRRSASRKRSTAPKRKPPPRKPEPTPALDAAFVGAVCESLTLALRSLPGNEEARPVRDTPNNRKFIAQAVKEHGTDLEQWQHVIEAQRRKVLESGEDKYQYLRLRTICSPATFQTLLDAPLSTGRPSRGKRRDPIDPSADFGKNPANLPTGASTSTDTHESEPDNDPNLPF